MPGFDLRSVSRGTVLRLGGGLGVALSAGASRALAAGAGETGLLTRWAAGWSALGSPQNLLRLVTSDVIYEDVAVGDVTYGTEGLRAIMADAVKAIPNFHIQLFDGFATDTMAAAEYAITGSQTGDLPYLKATGKSFRLRAASVFVLQNDKIARESRYYDIARFLTQLGALPSTDLPRLGTPALTPGGHS